MRMRLFHGFLLAAVSANFHHKTTTTTTPLTDSLQDLINETKRTNRILKNILQWQKKIYDEVQYDARV